MAGGEGAIPHLAILTWHQSLAVALACGVLSLLLHAVPYRRVAGVRVAAREIAITLVLFAVWQVAGAHARTRVAGAFAHAREVWHVERALHLPNELSVQAAILPHSDVVRAFDTFYLYMHLNVMVLTLTWLLVRHREHYPPVRNTLAISSALCLAVQMIPVAPPRMLPDLGFVDTALKYGQSAYGSMGSGIANQLSAMPSLHIGWAAVVAYAVVRASTRPWRWLIVLHPFVMEVVVAGTANHWYLDGIVAAFFVGVTAAVDHRLRLRGRARRVREHAPLPTEPAEPEAVTAD